jgi:(p)ppGpp synthase/HD superfamily hydrolase
MLEKAINIAIKAHSGAVDKAGAPYILHPLRVMFKMNSPDEMIVAVMHDVIEDSGIDIQTLKDEGFSQTILDAIDSVTRKKAEGEDYNDFIKRAAHNPIGRKVKLADLEDNMNILRISSLSGNDLKRIKKYHTYWRAINESM